MSSFFSSLNPINSFPPYHGPYEVGTVDVEVPTADIAPVSDAPEAAQPTVSFRIFYPCVKPAKDEEDRPVRWVPQPQRINIASVIKYVGLSERVAGALSYLPQLLYWVKLPAHRNARLLDPPTSNSRWSVTFFSHGLAGSRNTYSQICGELASSGMIVIALDHRDGSSPVQYVRETADTPAHVVYPTHIPHSPLTDEVHEARDKQLRIRIWEICMAYEALMKMDGGHKIDNLDLNTSWTTKGRKEVLGQFSDMLDIHRPGKVVWAGHSFGAATMVQLLKSVFYNSERTDDDSKPLITPHADAAIIQQVAPESPALLLDMWCTPLKSPFQRFLFDRPLPSYATGGPDGSNILSVLSESFHNWKDNLNLNKLIVSKSRPSRRPSVVTPTAREKGKPLPAFARLRANSPASDSGYASSSSDRSASADQPPPSQGPESSAPSQISSAVSSNEGANESTAGPHMFYVATSQHFNQSDYGILFPWLAQKFTKAEEPERCLELNIRAMVQVLREAGIELGGKDDRDILSREQDHIRRWHPISLDGQEDHAPSTSSGSGTVDTATLSPSSNNLPPPHPPSNTTPSSPNPDTHSTPSSHQLERRQPAHPTHRSPEIQAQLARDTEEAEMSPTGTLTMGQKTDAQLEQMGSLELPGPA
ncbi:hypothetical protein KC343_g5442 [Hortaea werneckii]|uniref:1-alkyl-2-acetylglycerophosphocholine esterase n=1 Tax=Hortaea werneckii TaxID=91943 RepID=A0A3M7HHX4_HORWE|nr:hypothetical protein KC352_g12256 [Hortaea werneckii]KAI7568816.1 hypothetical protein KC317_g3856 [Hortaea werneckii]KAI7621986.1 hypothetical protein KC346_g3420 [Hortaea werneckii]KAI7629074.1 hypothetical protein KC343_g5442 [Hortaea werneckii]KAI7663696.1 hypothetical protein KC319_g7664 [Hortaea werneckii]